ncbi:MAG: hypothetical protein QOI54_1202 [Actinomycetota bacterium]|jgi:DNA-binding SARP family transcriptional activator|nr:hypothetical protein [Actinomycetota bacterium]
MAEREHAMPHAYESLTEVVSDRIEVRVLGTLQVRRTDGELVSPRDWRTGKTADLLRLLALSNAELVPVGTLLEALWPSVDEQRARASLRTAASHLRKILGPDSVERHHDGLRLVGAWVDAGAFTQLVGEVSRHRRQGRLAESVRATREAESLYIEEFRAHDADAEWALQWREQLAHAHRAMLTDAAEAAVELGWMRDAVGFASRVLERDYCNERAYRALIQGYAGLGETERALRTFERCRAVLAEELGADPSPQTQAVHLQVLRAEPVSVDTAPWVGRHAEVQWLSQVLETVATSRRAAVVRLTGAEGSGRHRLVEEACRRTGVRELVPATGVSGDDLLRQVGDGDAVAVVLPDAEITGSADGRDLLRALMRSPVPVALVLTGEPLGDQSPELPLPDGVIVDLRHLEVQPLTEAETEGLAVSVLGGPVAAQLAAELMSVSRGNPGRALETLTEWTRGGRITATAGGLVLAAVDSAAPHAAIEPMLARIVDRLDAGELEVLALAALIEVPMSVVALADLVDIAATPSERRAAVQAAIDHLADLAVVTTAEQGVALRDPVLRPAVESWLRPAVRRRLHVRIAEQARVSPAERVRHWIAAGESELACAAALDAARLAATEGRWSEAHDHLLQVWRLADADTSPEDRLDLHERLGDACTALGRREEARESYLAAVNLSRANGLEAVGRVTAKLDSVVAGAQLRRRASDRVRTPELSLVPVAPGEVHADSQDWAATLHEVETELLPRREFDKARSMAALAATRSADPAVRAQAVLLSHLPDLLLGNPAAAEEPLRRAAEEARLTGAHDAARTLDLARGLLVHDRGTAPDRRLDTSGLDGEGDGAWCWTTVRILIERGETTAAALLEPRLPLPGSRPVVRHLGMLSSAELRLASGEVQAAKSIFETLLDEALRDGNTFLVPLVAARLVCLVAADDVDAAQNYFDLLDLASGPGGDLPREQVWRQLARAAIRTAVGRPRAAAASAAIAAKVATDIGVLPLVARAEARRATYLREAGALVESRLAATEAARLRSRFGLAGVDDTATAADSTVSFGRARLKMAALAGDLIAVSGGLSGAAMTAVGFF